MKEITIKLPVDVAIFMARFFNASFNSWQEIKKTNQFKHAMGQDDYDRVVISSKPLSKINLPEIHFRPFADPLLAIGINFNKPRALMIGEHEVKFLDDGAIQVGCTKVHKETLDAIYAKLYKQ